MAEKSWDRSSQFKALQTEAEILKIRKDAKPEVESIGEKYDDPKFKKASPKVRLHLADKWIKRAFQQEGDHTSHIEQRKRVYRALGINGTPDQFSAGDDEKVVQRIKDFQQANNLEPDGIIGPRTLEKLDWASENFSKPVEIKDGKGEKYEPFTPASVEEKQENTPQDSKEQEKNPSETSPGTIPPLETPTETQLKEKNAMLKVNQENLDTEKAKEKTILETLNTKEADLKQKETLQLNAQKAFDGIDTQAAQRAVEAADQQFEESVRKEAEAQKEFATSENPALKSAFEQAQINKEKAKAEAKEANKKLLEIEQKKTEAKKVLDDATKDLETANAAIQPIRDEQEYTKDTVKVLEKMVEETKADIQDLNAQSSVPEEAPAEKKE